MELALVLLCVLVGVTAILYAGLRPPLTRADHQPATLHAAQDSDTAPGDTTD